MMKQAIIGLQGGRTLGHKATPTNSAQGLEVNTHSPPPTVFVSSVSVFFLHIGSLSGILALFAMVTMYYAIHNTFL